MIAARHRLVAGRGIKRALIAVATLVVVLGAGAAASLHTCLAAPPFATNDADKLVFALYFPPYPVSLDNLSPKADYYATQYLNPDGEKGKHAYSGGLLRDRPIPRDPRKGDWRMDDLQDEVLTAKYNGLDGFTIDILTRSSNPEWVTQVPKQMLQAAQKVAPGFKIMLMPDMSGELADLSQDELAKEVMGLASYPSAFRLADGRLVVTPFLAEAHDAQWWTGFLNIMKNQYKTPVAFVPQFLDPGPHLTSFAPISYGMSEWGGRNTAFNPVTGKESQRVKQVHDLGLLWMQPVSVQDARPNQSIYDEASNTANLRATWQIAIDNKAQWVQMNTWNDYSEGTSFAPSVKHGTAFLYVNGYYINLFKTGVAPRITTDRIVLTHRLQLAAAPSTYRESAPMVLRKGSTPAADVVEALTFFTAPAQVTVTAGANKKTCSVPAGVSTCTVPLGPPGPDGSSISATAIRTVNSIPKTIASVTSPMKATGKPYVQDMEYAAAVSK